MNFSSLKSLLSSLRAPVHYGYAQSLARAPYIVLRPSGISPDDHQVNGEATLWSEEWAVYIVTSSSESNYSLATKVARLLHGSYLAGSTLSAQIGFIGEKLAGCYESQISISVQKGSL